MAAIGAGNGDKHVLGRRTRRRPGLDRVLDLFIARGPQTFGVAAERVHKLRPQLSGACYREPKDTVIRLARTPRLACTNIVENALGW